MSRVQFKFSSQTLAKEFIGKQEVYSFDLVDRHEFEWRYNSWYIKNRGFELSEAIALSNAINPIIPVKLIQIGDQIEISDLKKTDLIK